MKQGVLEKYREFLPITPKTPIITLGEGDMLLLKLELNKLGGEA